MGKYALDRPFGGNVSDNKYIIDGARNRFLIAFSIGDVNISVLSVDVY